MTNSEWIYSGKIHCNSFSSNNEGTSELKEDDVDLEDGEIEDDEEETFAPVPEAPKPEGTPTKPPIEKVFDKDR